MNELIVDLVASFHENYWLWNKKFYARQLQTITDLNASMNDALSDPCHYVRFEPLTVRLYRRMVSYHFLPRVYGTLLFNKISYYFEHTDTFTDEMLSMYIALHQGIVVHHLYGIAVSNKHREILYM